MYHFYWFGMHAYWWIFWVILWMLFFSFMMPVRRSSWVGYRDFQTPLQLLQRRYAARVRSQARNTRNTGLSFCGTPRQYKSAQRPIRRR